MASPPSGQLAASIIRQSVRYLMGAWPSRPAKRRAKLGREAPASRARSATVHRRARSAWIALTARRSWESASANRQPAPLRPRSSVWRRKAWTRIICANCRTISEAPRRAATQFQAHRIHRPTNCGSIRLAVKVNRRRERAEQETRMRAGEFEVTADDEAFAAKSARRHRVEGPHSRQALPRDRLSGGTADRAAGESNHSPRERAARAFPPSPNSIDHARPRSI